MKKKKTRLQPDPPPPLSKDVENAVYSYHEAGMSFIPISMTSPKQPAFELLSRWDEEQNRDICTWKTFTERLPAQKEIYKWYVKNAGHFASYGIAIIAGKVSGNLEILDLDHFDLVAPFREELEKRAPGLFERLVTIRTPRPGLHLYYRCDVISGNQKLARIQDPSSQSPKPKTIIETRGEGGYCLAPPSPADCHPSKRCYLYESDRRLTQVTRISPDERNALLEVARTFNKWELFSPLRQPLRQPQHSRRNVANPREVRPGDDFNQRANWAEILQPHGWGYAGQGTDGSDRWTRPGKGEGASATTNYAGSDLLYVFSSNADPFEAEAAYDKFAALAWLEFNGNFNLTSRYLRDLGYGSRGQRRRQKPKRQRFLSCRQCQGGNYE